MSTAAKPVEPTVEILIVEDSPTQAQRLEYILRQHSYHVTAAANGRRALEAAARRKPALIISDVVMPEMDGYELCRRIKADANLSDIPVILVTTLSDPQDVIRGLECRADNFILKPYDERYLLGRVQFVILNREMRQSERTGMGVEIFFHGEKHFITADRLQILNLLLSTYEAAIQRNKELSRTQEDLRQLNQKLESANQELEAFSYSVSHDLRAPLRAISGFTRILREDYGAQLPAGAQGYLETISRETARMGQLIDDLLRFAQLSRQPLRQRSFAAADLARQAIEELQPDRADRRVDVVCGDLPVCQGDPALLKQVWLNLLSNAFKYTRTRAEARVEIGCERRPAELVFSVRDNGVGFDMRYADKLFGVFQRLHRAEDFEGTGVGLAIVQSVIHRHGGRVWAEAKPGEGAALFFTLPVPSERAGAAEQPSANTNPPARGKPSGPDQAL